jgi:hypothetical protein
MAPVLDVRVEDALEEGEIVYALELTAVTARAQFLLEHTINDRLPATGPAY